MAGEKQRKIPARRPRIAKGRKPLDDEQEADDPQLKMSARTVDRTVALKDVKRTKVVSRIHNYLVARDASTGLSLLINSISKKSLRLSSWSRTEWPTARVINLVTVDAEALAASAPFFHHAWAAVLEVIIALSLIYFTIGPPVLAAVAIMASYIPFNYCCSSIIRSYQAKQMQMKDSRVKFTKEVVHGMSVVKMYAWEEAFEKEIRRQRKEEVKLLKNATLVTRILQSINSAAPFLVAIACFTWFVLSSSNNILTPSVAFVALTVFNQLRRPMALVAPAVQFISKAIVCSKRIEEFLKADELHTKHDREDDQPISIKLENSFFSWGKEKEHLKDITLQVKEGEVHAIVGPVGSGKSSLLSAILGSDYSSGEMTHLDGTRKIGGTIAYVPQSAWILNHTVRGNILYGMDYERNKYDKVLRACELKKDIFTLPRCDATIVGENVRSANGIPPM
ncbi:ABC transporter transmembrane region [Ancylostoma ceylanicum]|uniref:ABC transporter transmembrane region n=1 Tax=Ancylostoma ceylanicum TaxID=53326 RepID=A0A0D6LRH7_9BILA|nr:ABC transporter transmembrane region [Ancylostoma ceylanicum]